MGCMEMIFNNGRAKERDWDAMSPSCISALRHSLFVFFLVQHFLLLLASKFKSKMITTGCSQPLYSNVEIETSA